ncbi:flavin monoamine oxidase family protein [Nocardioides dongxiaopingii]|uniref:flavin monoamine oxidase family protein n=1 Tax=Nocardioides sp. S-1144 TaxID=2582905 RepID=UPI0016521F83|nr:NAD(P)/FAD-dependent oxidoreductase [Nocardioides sp. S-1144]
MTAPDFPFDHVGWLEHPHGIGRVGARHVGRTVAVIGAGIAGTVAADALSAVGLRPVVYDGVGVGGRMRSVPLRPDDPYPAELGAMRFSTRDHLVAHYLRDLGLRTYPFPNPLSPAAPRALVDVGGVRRVVGRGDLPADLAAVDRAWRATVEDVADVGLVGEALAERDAGTVLRIWPKIVRALDEVSLRSVLLESPHFTDRTSRDLFGHVGFGSGGWDTDFDNGVLEVLRVVAAGLDTDHVGVVGGCQQLPRLLWDRTRAATGQERLGGEVAAVVRDGAELVVTERSGRRTRHAAVVCTAPVRHLLVRLRVAEELLAPDVVRGAEGIHYMASSKVLVPVDRAYWLDPGQESLLSVLTDRYPRAVYLFGQSPEGPGTVCLSYTWNDDADVFRGMDAEARAEACLRYLDGVLPGHAVREHRRGPAVAVTWDEQEGCADAFSQNLPGQYDLQRGLYCDFVRPRPPGLGFYVAGDDVSWTGGFAGGAIATALNAVWGVARDLGGSSPPSNPGPGDRFAELAPVELGPRGPGA